VNILIDEHLSPRLARALAALFHGKHEVVHLRDKFGPAVKDTEWIAALSSEGRWAVISADRRITRNRAEYNAFRNSKLIGFFMAPSIHKAPLTRQMARLLTLWDSIIDLATRVEGGAMFELPGRSQRIKQLKL
jgi:hypothetical protein